MNTLGQLKPTLGLSLSFVMLNLNIKEKEGKEGEKGGKDAETES